MVITDIKKVFVVRSASLFRVEYRLTEAESFSYPMSYNALIESLGNIARNARRELKEMVAELEKVGYRYIELYRCEEQEDGLLMSINGNELIVAQRGNLHGLSHVAEDRLAELGYVVKREE